MTIPLPPENGGLCSFLKSQEFSDLVTKIGGPVGAAIAACRFLSSRDWGWAVAMIVTALVTASFAVRSWKKDQATKAKLKEHDCLRGVLETLHAAIVEVGEHKDDPGLRLCIYAPDHESPDKPADWLYQVTPYVGEDSDKDYYGRKMQSGKGVVGRSYRFANSRIIRLPAGRDLVDFLMNDFGFTKAEAEKSRRDRKSWAAVPIGDEEIGVFGVIYADSKHEDFFGSQQPTEEGSIQERLLVRSSIAAARFCKFYYNPNRGKKK